MAKKIQHPDKNRWLASKKQKQRRTSTKNFALIVGIGLLVLITAAVGVFWPESGTTELAKETVTGKEEARKDLETFKFRVDLSNTELTTEEKDRLLREEQIDVVKRLAGELPDDADVVFLTAMAYREQGNSVEAARGLERCLELQPNRADAYDHLGRIAQEQGRHEEAVGYFQKAEQIEPRMAGLHYRIGEAYQSWGKIDEAISEVRKNAELFPRAEDNYVRLGELYLQKQDYAAARVNYEKAIELNPNVAKAYFGLASVCARLGEREKAGEYRLKFKEVEDAKREVAKERRVTFDPLWVTCESVAHTHTDVGRVLNVRGKNTAAEKLWQRAAELDPNNVTCRFGLADNLLRRDSLSEALRWYQEIIRVQADNGVAYFFIGHIYEKLKRLSDAQQAYEKVTEVTPDRPEGFLALSQLLFENEGDLVKAGQLAQRAAELSPTAANCALVARIQHKRGDRNKALSAVQKALQLAPQNPEYLRLEEEIRGN